MNVSGFLSEVLLRFFSRIYVAVPQSVLDRTTTLDGLTDDELRAHYARLLKPDQRGAKRSEDEPRRGRFSLVNWLLQFAGIGAPTRELIETLALGWVAFKRAPADLRAALPPPQTPCLFPEQIAAAADLCRGAFVQMGTGEGKTYAILPAAIHLLMQYPAVYIVCASNYLAWRDANRTRSFWEFFGIRVGLCLRTDDTPEQKWSAQIVYTTLPALVFKSMYMDIDVWPDAYPLVFGALVLDEADAIVLDSSFQSFEIVRRLQEADFDWARAEEVARSLGPGDIDIDHHYFSANLTIDGQSKVREFHAVGGAKFTVPFQIFRQGVELAYIATQVAQQDNDYIIDEADGRVYPINRVSGFVERMSTPPWVFCLEHRLGFTSQGRSIAIHAVMPFAVLTRFPHVCGLSGTTADNVLEYLLFHNIPVSQIPPRYPRNEKREQDLVYTTAEEAYDAVVLEARGYVAKGRAVLIGTQSINDAEEVYERASRDPEIRVPVRLITGKNEEETVRFFEDAGQAPAVTVATQLAGRGVDIRLSPEVRQKGGMALICLRHGLEARHDRQFVGRVGRQGDPCTVQFVLSLDDRLFKIVGADQARKLLEAMGMQRGEAIQHAWVDRAITNAQRKIARREMLNRLNRQYVENIYLPQAESLCRWFEMLRVGDQTDQRLCPEEFIDFAIDAYLEKHLLEHLRKGRTVSKEQAAAIAAVIEADLGRVPKGLSPVDLEMRGRDFAENVIKDGLVTTLRKAVDTYVCTCEELYSAVVQKQEDKSIPASFPSYGSPTPVDEIYPPAPSQGTPGLADSMDSSFEIRSADGCRSTTAAVEDEGSRQRRAELLRTFYRRPPKAGAVETIINLWADFIDRRKSIVDRVEKQHGRSYESGIIIRRQVAAAFDRANAEMARSLVRNLANADHPESPEMDRLFFLAEHQSASRVTEPTPPSFEWTSSAVAVAPREGRSATQADPISQFLARYRAELQEPFELNEEQVRRIIAGFLAEHPMETLRVPSSILKAVDAWFEDIVEKEGIPLGRARQNRRWLWQFLKMLREQHLIGPLPRAKDRALSLASRLFANVKDAKILLILSGMLAYFAALASFALIRVDAQPWAWGEEIVRFLDAVAFAGTAEQKSLLVPILMILFALQIAPHLRTAMPSYVAGWGNIAVHAGLLSAYLLSALAAEAWPLRLIEAIAFALVAWLLTRPLQLLSEWLKVSLDFNPITGSPSP